MIKCLEDVYKLIQMPEFFMRYKSNSTNARAPILEYQLGMNDTSERIQIIINSQAMQIKSSAYFETIPLKNNLGTAKMERMKALLSEKTLVR